MLPSAAAAQEHGCLQRSFQTDCKSWRWGVASGLAKPALYMQSHSMPERRCISPVLQVTWPHWQECAGAVYFRKSELGSSVRAACTCALARTGIIGVHVILVHIEGFKGVILIIICSNCAAAQRLLVTGAKAERTGACRTLMQGRRTQLLDANCSLMVRAKTQLVCYAFVQKAGVAHPAHCQNALPCSAHPWVLRQ